MRLLNIFQIIVITVFAFAEKSMSFCEWENAGLLPNTPAFAHHVINVNNYSGTDDQKVLAALSAARTHSLAGKTSIIYFPTGTYNLAQTITLQPPDSNIIFQGDGSDATILNFNFGNPNPNCFCIEGDETSTHITTLTNDVDYLTHDIVANDLSGIDEGDWFRLSEHNHDVFPDDIDWAEGCVGQITRLTSKNGNNGVMEDCASKTYEYVDNSNLRLYSITPVRNIGIENLKIWRTDTDHASGGDQGITIVFKNAVNCWVKGVYSEQTCKHHIQASNSAHIFVNGCYFHDARWFRQGGYGYGVQLTGSTSRCLIENNIFDKLRHAMMVQAGANCNVFTFNYSYKQFWEEDIPGLGVDRGPICGFLVWPEWCGGDICLHGNYPFSNLFEHNWSCIIVADGFHGPNGSNNWFFRNITYDDERGDQHGVNLEISATFNTPVCQVGASMCSPDRATFVNVTGESGASAIEWFGHWDGSSGMYGHWPFYQGTLNIEWAHMPTTSIYYDSQPEFASGYSWPAVGPKLLQSDNFSSISQNIPARYRFQNSITKTYISDITDHPCYLSGTITQNLTCNGCIYITGNVSIASGVTLQINAGATINFTGSFKINVYGTLNISGSSGQHVTIDGMNHSRIGYSNAMIDVKDGAEADIQYADFVNSPYDVIIRTSADAVVSNSTFSNFGFDSGSRAITAYNSTGSVTINDCVFTGAGSKGIGVYTKNTDTNVTISSNTFNNCRIGVRSYSSDAFITGNSIHNSYYYGIQADNVTDDAEYRDNNVSGNFSSYGIYLNSSSPYLMYNYIHENKVLINAGNPEFATPYSEGLGHRGYNTITYASSPLIKVQNYASPFMGYYGGDWEDGGYNSIYDTDLPHIYVVNYSNVMADNNYWGSEGPVNIADGTSSISDENPLSTNPNPLSKQIASDGFKLNSDYLFLKETSSQGDKDDEKKFKEAVAAGFKLDYVKAKELLMDIIDKNSDSKYPPLAVLMYHCFTKKELKDEKSSRDNEIITGELTSLLSELSTKSEYNRLRPFGIKFSALESILNRDYDTMIAFNDQLIDEYPNSVHELTALYDEITYYVEIKDDLNKAKKLLSRMDSVYPEEELTVLAHILLGENVKLPKLKPHQQSETSAEVHIPSEFKLYPAFPNPFNPITSITYDIPEDVHVELKVYNIAGQELSVLVNEKKTAGSYTTTWSGENTPSGLYFFRIKAGNFIKTGKMTLSK
jgi:hypothetical protein